MATLLKHEINAWNRQYYIEKVNAPLVKAITVLANRFPKPTMENLTEPNAKRLLEILNEYNRFDGNPYTKAIVNAVGRAVINKVEHSPHWRDRVGFLVELLRAGDWRTRALNHPRHLWLETKPYGGNENVT